MGSREGLWELHTEDMMAAAYSAALVSREPVSDIPMAGDGSTEAPADEGL